MDESVLEKRPGGVWSPVFTLPRNEKKVFAALLKAGIPAYLPLRRQINVQPVVSKGKRYCYQRILHVPMFSNYLFAHISPEAQEVLNRTRSALRVIRVDEFQEEMLLDELRLIREIEKFSEGEEIDVCNGMQRGSDVVFTGGPFSGWRGVVLAMEPDGMAYINISSIETSIKLKYPAAWCMLCK